MHTVTCKQFKAGAHPEEETRAFLQGTRYAVTRVGRRLQIDLGARPKDVIVLDFVLESPRKQQRLMRQILMLTDEILSIL